MVAGWIFDQLIYPVIQLFSKDEDSGAAGGVDGGDPAEGEPREREGP
jgi:hypothetical protein